MNSAVPRLSVLVAATEKMLHEHTRHGENKGTRTLVGALLELAEMRRLLHKIEDLGRQVGVRKGESLGVLSRLWRKSVRVSMGLRLGKGEQASTAYHLETSVMRHRSIEGKSTRGRTESSTCASEIMSVRRFPEFCYDYAQSSFH